MFFAQLFAVSLLAAATDLAAMDGNSAQPAMSNTTTKVAAADRAASGGASSRSSKLSAGARAPDFQYQSYDALWQNLHNVLEHGDVLLVFGASDVDLRTLERERESLLRSGVMPLAVVERTDREVWASVRRLGLTFSLLADPRGVVGNQYGVFDATVGHSQVAWFVIDVKGRVRQSGNSMPSQAWSTVAVTALGRPQVGDTQAASKR